MNKVTTLNQFIIEKQAEVPEATGGFSCLLHHVGIAAKKVHREVNKAGLVDILGRAGTENVQGEDQQKLDVYANETFISELKASGECCGVASEENQDIIVFEEGMEMAQMEDFLQAGDDLLAAGYVIYGSSTMLVYTTGNGVNGFTLDTSIGEFCLSHPNIRTPENGNIYSINEGNYEKFPVGVKKYIKYCQETDKKTNRPYTSRYIGSLVADFHRNLLKGGIFIYPQTNSHPTGKLRLLYECNPMAFIAEQAGGLATDGEQRILGILPESIHQRVPFYTGAKHMMEKVTEFLRFFEKV